MTLCAVAVIAAILILVGSSLGDYDHVIYIDSVAGNDTDVCLISNNKSSPCQNLNWVLQQPQARQNSTHFVLSQGTHSLREPSSPFEDLTSLGFTGSDSVVVCTKVGTGLVFIKVKNVFFQNVLFFKCASHQNRSIKYFVENAVKDFQVGLYFYICENITMKHVHVSHSPNATGVGIFNTTGINSFENCNFSHNTVNTTQLKTDNHLIVGGGGMLIDTMHCDPDDTNCNEDNRAGFTGTEYRVLSCLFESNEAGVIGDLDKLYPYIMELSGFGCGGGLAVFMRHNVSGITFVVDDNMFFNNSALSGGGLFIQLNDNGHGNLISIENSQFKCNSCPHLITTETSGGAIRFQEYISMKKLEEPFLTSVKRNELIVNNCTLEDNWALKGGGIAIEAPLENSSKDKVPLYLVSSSVFKLNVAKLGAALYLEQFWKNSRREGIIAEFQVADCKFDNNSDRYYFKFPQGITKPLEIGIGSIYIYSSVVNFTGNNTFVRNYGSALVLSDANALFDGCYAYFLDNVGHSGAAISLFGASTFSVGTGTVMKFENNTATRHGGAIYAMYLSRQNLLSDATCFIRHLKTGILEDDWNVSMIFINNTDHGGSSPNAIYTTSTSPCSVISAIGSERDNNNTFCWKGWTYYNSSTSTKPSECQTYIDTDVGKIIFDGHEENSTDHVKAFPGWDFRMPILATNDYGRDMSNTTIFNLRNNYSDDTLYNWGDMSSISVPENVTVEITVETTGQRIWYFHFFADLQPCPPGFVISNGENLTKRCQCSNQTNLYGGSVYCSEKAQEARIVSGTWMGIYGGKYYTADCPAGFCEMQEERYLKLPNNSIDLNNMICASNRKGIICGECKDGYGPAIDYPMSDCVACNNTSLTVNIFKYLASVYLPLSVLFLFLIFFDIRLTAGPANAFILYSQVVSSTFAINADGGIPLRQVSETESLTRAYKIPYGIFNLRFIEQFIPSICFSTGMNTLDVLLLDYGVAFFPLLVKAIIVTLLKVKECCCVGRCVRWKCTHRINVIHNALLPAFAAFLLLSYSRVSNISAHLMAPTPLINKDGTGLNPQRLFLAGQFSKNDAEYYYYFIPGVIIFSTFVVIVPLLLLDFPLRCIEWLVNKSPCLSKYYPTVKIHILMDTFQGCYRKNMRCFAGLYFLFRLVITVSYAYCETWLEQFIIQQICTTFYIVLVSLLQPYKRKCINYIDILIFANLAVINSISMYFYIYYKTTAPHEGGDGAIIVAFIFQYFLIFLPLIGVLLYMLWWWKYSRFIILKCLIMIARHFISPFSSKYQELYAFAATNMEKTRRHFKKVVSYKEADSQEGMDALWERAEDENRYKCPNLTTMAENKSTGQVSSSSGTNSSQVTSSTGISSRRSSSRTYGALGPESKQSIVN